MKVIVKKCLSNICVFKLINMLIIFKPILNQYLQGLGIHFCGCHTNIDFVLTSGMILLLVTKRGIFNSNNKDVEHLEKNYLII